jgi:haloalkane dehalogenase
MKTSAPEWLDTNFYPFEHHYFDLPEGRMHYVDEGEGDVILFVHGTPTWSFLYRDFIKHLSKTHRCVAVDHLGFGLSDKPADYPGRPQDHAKNLHELIRHLDLGNITLVVHDFGGPIGLGAALEQPDRVNKIVIFNTWLWETASNPAVKKINKIANSMLGRFLYLRLNFSPKILLKKGFTDKSKLSKEVHRHYTKPFPDKDSRQSLLRLAESLYGSSDWYQAQWEKLSVLQNKSWLILWGTQDEFITTDYLKVWADRLPRVQVKTFDCGHFVQEERATKAIESIQSFLVSNTVSRSETVRNGSAF